MIQIDGSYGEGGGAVLRQALALSTLTGKPFEIYNIRKGRPVPGLKSQHLHSIIALEKLSNCVVTNCDIGSTRLTFIPGEILNKSIEVNVGTAGSITLLLQSLLLPAIFSGKAVSIKVIGGTDVKWSQPIDYLTNVLIPNLKMISEIEVQTIRRGYYPKGGGEVKVKIKGRKSSIMQQINITKKNRLLGIKGISHASADLMNEKVADRQADASQMLLTDLKVPINISRTYNKTKSTGSGITLFAIYSHEEEQEFKTPIILGADALGERGKKAEDVGCEAATRLREEIQSDAAVDKYLADQLIPFLAITKGEIKTSKITGHSKSNIYVAEKFLDTKFKIKDNTIKAF